MFLVCFGVCVLCVCFYVYIGQVPEIKLMMRMMMMMMMISNEGRSRNLHAAAEE